MAATDRRERGDRGAALAGTLTSSAFVTLRIAPSVDALVAAAMLTRMLDTRGTPFQARIATDAPRDAIAVGQYEPDREDPHLPPIMATETAADLADALDVDVSPGLVATGAVLGGETRHGEREGLGLPVDEPVDGLAHTTLLHGSFSGDVTRARAFVDRVPDDPTDLASAVTLDTVHTGSQTTVERILRPMETPHGPFETAPGAADVLDVLAEVDPGLALAVVLGDEGAREAALGIWRSTSTALHERCRTVEPSGERIVVADDDIDAPGVLARMLRDAHADVELVSVTGTDRIGIAAMTTESVDLASSLAEHCTEIVPRRDRRITAHAATDVDSIADAMREVSA